MKTKFMVLATTLLLAFTTTFAKDNSAVPASISNGLHQQFANVNNVQWQLAANYYKADFTINGQPLAAFYTLDGDMMGVARPLTAGELPTALLKEVQDKQSGNTVTDLFQLFSDRGTEYYITYQTSKGTKTYKSNGDHWMRY